MHIWICKFQVGLLFLALQGISSSIGTSNFFPRVFDGFFELRIFRINEVNTSQLSCIVEFWLLDCPFFLFSSSRSVPSTSLTIFLATDDLASMLFASLSAAPRTMHTRREVFHSIL